MLKQDVRSLALCLVLGDGCLHYQKTPYKNKVYVSGGITIAHENSQRDILVWKARMLSEIFGKTVNVREVPKINQGQISINNKTLRSWRKFFYPNGKKSIPKMLKYIKHPELALAVLLMDDGYIEAGSHTLVSGEKVRYGGRIRIFTCDQTYQQHLEILEWMNNNFGVSFKIKYAKNSKRKKSYPFIQMNQKDSLVIWEIVRNFILQFKSMQHKFRYIEQKHQLVSSQRTPSKDDDIVRSKANT